MRPQARLRCVSWGPAARWAASRPDRGGSRDKSFCPCQKPAKTLGFRRFSFCLCCTGMGFTLVRTPGFPIRLHLPLTVLIPSSTQNAPGSAFFGLFLGALFCFPLFLGRKIFRLFLCILPYSGYKLKPSVMPCRREVSFFTLFSSLSVLLLIPLLQKTCYNFLDFYPRQPQEATVYAFRSMWKPRG